jgi:phage shock protein PspC (stress-responsive transcriptional regulator)
MAPISRAREGRWLGGVCAGLGGLRGLRTGWVRAGFVLLALLGGLGIGLYLACWLIIPAAADDAGERTGGGPVEVAQACAAGVGLAVLAGFAAVATLFGFGWLVLVLAVVVTSLVLWARNRVGPAWVLLPLIALTVPAVAVAASGLRLAPQTGASIVTPSTSAQLSSRTYRSGLGTLLLDLRHTTFPSGGTVPLHIAAGVKRTIVALPAGQCVRVELDYHVNTFVAAAGALIGGRAAPYSYVTVFGRLYTQRNADIAAGGNGPYPILKINFSSQGGSLYVRDYPDGVDPDVDPDWPGYLSPPEPRPNLRIEPRRLRKKIMRAYLRRARVAAASRRLIERLMPGPCG